MNELTKEEKKMVDALIDPYLQAEVVLGKCMANIIENHYSKQTGIFKNGRRN